MFVDLVKVSVTSGKGGDGAIAWRREKYVPAGGPAGGDGGNGGSVYFEATSDLHTLLDFQYRHKFQAVDGEKGRPKNQYGKAGDDLVIKVPCGTVIREAKSQVVLADLLEAGERFLAAKGGRGGRGNTKFASAQRKAPHFAEPGEMGIGLELLLELKLLADVGLVGLPNAGKSSFLAAATAARPKIADYPFTTLVPNLGVVRFPQGDGFVVADIPGLIAGAHQGVGLGHEFLRHIERNRLLLHLVDVASDDPVADFQIVEAELEAYGMNLETKPRLVALNKADLMPNDAAEVAERFEIETGLRPFVISAAAQTGLEPLLYAIQARLAELPVDRQRQEVGEVPVDHLPPFQVHRDPDGVYVIDGARLQGIVSLTDFDDEGARRRFEGILENMGILEALRGLGVEEGNTVRIGSLEFTYYP